MKKRVISIAAALMVVLTGAVMTALPSSAYIRKDCTVFVDARGSSTASAINSTTSQMHVDENSYVPASGLKMYSNYILVDGVRLPGTQDQYLNVYINSPHTVQFWFRGSDAKNYMCSVSYASGTAR